MIVPRNNIRKKPLFKKMESAFEEAPWWGKIILVGIPLLLALAAIYLPLQDQTIKESDLSRLQLSMSATPRIIKNVGKTTSYSLQLSTYKYQERLLINDAFTYKATNIKMATDSIQAGDLVTLKIRTSDLAELMGNAQSIISVYGLEENGHALTDLALRNKLAKNDTKWALLLIPLVLIFLYYALVKKKQKLK